MKSSLLMLPLLLMGMVTGLIVDPLNAHGQQPAKTDKDKLNGDWILIANESRGIVAEIFGQLPEPDKLRTVTFSDDQMKLKIDDKSIPIGPYQLDPTKAPKTLDVTIKTSRGKKATLEAIYELDGNQLKLCFDSFAEERPTKFPTRAKDPEKSFGRLAVLVFRRIGADPKLDTLDRNKAKCASNLATLARIMHDQVSDERIYPTAAIYSKDGKPLLSWRVALLKRMDEDDLLKEFKIDEPWDSAHNKQLIKKMPKIYALPGVETKELGMTFFQVFTGKGTIFEGKEGLKFTDHLKGDGPNFMIVEAGEGVVWTKPDDLAYDPQKPLPKLGRLSDEGFLAAMTFLGDRVQFIPRSTPEKKLRSMIQWRSSDDKGKQ
ncbi:MAG: TIGR03067 domain-containing protein [Planctomycetes bacterium]|nr:TIGR03067 domain-containing protein [Planctomycetota bacterium]